MGGGGGTQTVKDADPWSGQQPYLRDIFGEAQAQYNQGVGQEYYPGSTVAPFSPQTEMGIDWLTQRALGGSAQQDMMGNYLLGSMGQGNINPYAIAGGGFDAMQGIAPGMNMAYMAGQQTPDFFGTAGAIQNQFGNFVDPITRQQLGSTAMGGYLGSNPYLDQVYDTAAGNVMQNFQQDIMPSLHSSFGTAGRTGGGLHQLYAGEAAGEAMDTLAGLAGDIYAPAYESERNRQIQAAQQLGALGQTGGLAGMQTAADLYRTGWDRAAQVGLGMGDLGIAGMSGLGDLYGNISTDAYRAASMVPTFSGMQYTDIENLMKAGAMTEEQAQRLIDAERARFDFYQQAPGAALGQYAGIIQGMPTGYGSTSMTEAGGTNPVMGALGGGLTGAAMAPYLGAMGPYGWAIGAGIGLLSTM